MADELKLTISATGDKDGQSAYFKTSAETYDLNGKGLNSSPQNIATTWTALTIPAWAASENATFVMVKNLDTTNYVELATANDGSGIFTKISANDGTRPAVAIFPPYTGNPTYYGRANTSAVWIQTTLWGT